MFISGWSQSWDIHELSPSVFFFPSFFKPIIFFFPLGEKEACCSSVPSLPPLRFKETGPCNCKLPVKKTKPLAPFLAKASRSVVIAEINESCCWAAGLLVVAEMKRQQLKLSLRDEHSDKDFCLGYSYYTCHGLHPGLRFLGTSSDLLTNNHFSFLSKRNLFSSSDHTLPQGKKIYSPPNTIQQ